MQSGDEPPPPQLILEQPNQVVQVYTRQTSQPCLHGMCLKWRPTGVH